jgi:hypothetical protein
MIQKTLVQSWRTRLNKLLKAAVGDNFSQMYSKKFKGIWKPDSIGVRNAAQENVMNVHKGIRLFLVMVNQT